MQGQDKLDLFLLDKLDENERLEVIKLLGLDRVLREEMFMRKGIVNALGEIYKEDLIIQFREFEKENQHEHIRNSERRKWLYRLLGIAAVGTLLLLFGLNLFKDQNLTSSENLFSTYYEPPEIDVNDNIRSGIVLESKNPGLQRLSLLIDSAILMINERHPQLANQYLQEFERQDSAAVYSDTYQFYLGLSHLVAEDFTMAAKTLQEIRPESFSYGQNAAWYRAFALLAQPEKQTEAYEAFQRLGKFDLSAGRDSVRREILEALGKIQEEG